MKEELASLLLGSIAADRLVIFCGAGVSICPPSRVPSADRLARECIEKREVDTGEDLSSLLADQDPLGALAEHFKKQGILINQFLRHLVDWRRFKGKPNRGHEALADFLWCGAADLGITTNVDWLVEKAAERLGRDDFESATDGQDAAVPRQHRPYLKLHGCCVRDRESTLWCKGQLRERRWQTKLRESRFFLSARLSNRDVVLVGFWSDWAYLDEALIRCLANKKPKNVIVVDPANGRELAARAPRLWEWAHRKGIGFEHVRASGPEFLDELRARYSRQFLRQVLDRGKAPGKKRRAAAAHTASLETLDCGSLYDLRRDLTGKSRVEVVREKRPDAASQTTGGFLLDLLAKGGSFQGSEIVLGNKRIRVIRAVGRRLSSVRADFGREAAPGPQPPDYVVCVGAEDDGVPVSIMRTSTGADLIRTSGTAGKWMDTAQARRELAI